MNDFIKQVNGSTLTVLMHGKLDSMNSSEFSADLLSSLENINQLVLDFSGLIYISSAGLRVLLHAKKQMNQQKGEMIVKNLSSEIEEVFSMTGFDKILKVE